MHLEEGAERARRVAPALGGAEAPHPFHTAPAPIDPDNDSNTGWRGFGALLSLDLAFVHMGLVLIPFAPQGGALGLGATLTPDDRQFLALAAALFDPARATEAGPHRRRRAPWPGARAGLGPGRDPRVADAIKVNSDVRDSAAGSSIRRRRVPSTHRSGSRPPSLLAWRRLRRQELRLHAPPRPAVYVNREVRGLEVGGGTPPRVDDADVELRNVATVGW